MTFPGVGVGGRSDGRLRRPAPARVRPSVAALWATRANGRARANQVRGQRRSGTANPLLWATLCVALIAAGCGHGTAGHLASGAAPSVGVHDVAPSNASPPSTAATVLAGQIADLRAPTQVEIYPIPPTPGCSGSMTADFAARVYALALQGTVAPPFDFVQKGITYKFEVQAAGASTIGSAYTFNAATDVLHRPQSAGVHELTLRVPAAMGGVLAAADQAACAGRTPKIG